MRYIRYTYIARQGVGKSTQPIHEYKAQFFQALAHPLRIHVLELLRDGPKAVGELQDLTGHESSNISQQLAILRKQRIVYGRKRGTSVFYEVVDPLLFAILDVSREMFLNQLQDMQNVIADSAPPSGHRAQPTPQRRDVEDS